MFFRNTAMIVLAALCVWGQLVSVSRADTVGGKVTEAGTGNPVAGAEVFFISPRPDTVRAVTDAAGDYSLELDLYPVGVDQSAPVAFALRQNYPNPFNPSTTIEYSLSRPGHVQLTVYSITGQMVRELVDTWASAGVYRVRWDGTDRNGAGVAAGVYLYRFAVNGRSEVRKMLLLDGGAKSATAAGAPAPAYRPVAKTAAGPAVTFVVKREGYVTYEDYGFTVPASLRGDAVIQKKTAATVYGSFSYRECSQCWTGNWNGIIDPIDVTIYDSEDYSIAHSTRLEYPDSTYELSGIQSSRIDIVIQGNDIISKKKSLIAIAYGDNTMNGMPIRILYDSDPRIGMISPSSFFIYPKISYNDSLSAKSILNDYGINLTGVYGETDVRCYGCRVISNTTNSIQAIQLLNNDPRVLFTEADYLAVFD